jgi:hypothetical protein
VVIAALLCFVALLVAWALAPDDAAATSSSHAAFEPELEAELAPAA